MERLGYTFRDASLLEHALTHSSYAMATHCPMGDNERMEYLGGCGAGTAGIPVSV